MLRFIKNALPGRTSWGRKSSRSSNEGIVTQADRARDARDWQRAAQLYRQELDERPQRAPIWVQYGHALKEIGSHTQSEAAYRQAIACDPEDADAYLHLGHVLKLQARLDEAQANYLRAFALNPTLTDPTLELRRLGWPENEITELLRHVSGLDQGASEFARQTDLPVADAGEAAKSVADPTRGVFCVDGPFVDHGTLGYFGSELSISGWAILPSRGYKLEVYLGDRPIGDIVPTYAREDVRQLVPGLAEDMLTGFNATLNVQNEWLSDTPDTIVRIALEHHGAPQVEVKYRLRKSVARVEICIDEPRRVGGKLIVDSRNAHFSGWAVAQSAIERLTIAFDDNIFKVAQYGLPRADVLALHPRSPNGAFVGFSAFFETVPVNCQTVTFAVALKDGFQFTRDFSLDVKAAPDPTPVFRKLGYAEKQYLATQAPPRRHPHCYVILAPQGDASNALLRATARSIAKLQGGGPPPVVLGVNTRAWQASTADLLSIEPVTDLATQLKPYAGSWLTFLQPGDVVAPSLDLFLDRAGHRHHDFLYWDEITQWDGHEQPLLKVPGAPFITLLHQNIAGRGWAIRITGTLAGLDRFDSIEQLPSVLPLLAFADPARCGHIPETLSRHRYTANPTVLNSEDFESRAAVLSCCKSIYGPLKMRTNPDTRRPGHFLDLDVPDDRLPRVSVIIPTIGAQRRILACLHGLRTLTNYPKIEIIVLDHTPDEAEFTSLKATLRASSDRVIPVSGAFNWSRFNNLGAAAATGDLLLFLNDDIDVIDPMWLRRLVPYLSLEDVGSVGPRLLYSATAVQSCGVSLIPERAIARNDFAFTAPDSPLCNGINLIPHNCTSLLGAAMMTRAATFRAVGRFDEAFPLTFNDLDYHMRLRQRGLQVVINPDVSLIHHEKTSRALIPEQHMDTTYWRRWHRQQLPGDPYVHPALETHSGMYKIEREPVQTVWNKTVAGTQHDINRILVLRLDHIGDFVATLPAFVRLRERFPAARIDIVVGRWNQHLARSFGIFDHIMVLDYYNERSGEGVERDRADIRVEFRDMVAARSYDLAIDFRLDSDTRLLLTEVNAEFRAGFSEGLKHPWLDISIEWEGNLKLWRKNAGVSEILCRLVSFLADKFPRSHQSDIDYWNAVPGQLTQSAELDRFTSSARRVVLHPFSGHSLKMWPQQKWSDLVALLIEDQVAVLVVGSPKDSTDSPDALAEFAALGAINAVGLFSLDELTRVLRQCHCFVGCDSGPKHLAASVGVPIVSVQSGFVDPVLWGPMNLSGVSVVKRVNCAPCYIDSVSDCPRNLECMKGIAVNDVYSLVTDRLPTASPRSRDRTDRRQTPLQDQPHQPEATGVR